MVIAHNRKVHGIAAAKAVYNYYKRNARNRDLEYAITFEEFLQLTQKNCYYCDRKPFQTFKRLKYAYYGDYTYNGIDRVNNEKGYIVDNIVACCKQCNFAKHTLGQTEFIDLCKMVATNHGKDIS